MKKRLFLLIFAVIGIITTMTICDPIGTSSSCNDLFNANIEALAWNGPGGADVVSCVEGGPTCYHTIILCDERGNPLKDLEGNTISFTERIDGMKNPNPEAQ